MSSDIQFHSLGVEDIQQETDNAVCVTFKVPPELNSQYQFKQGQYITLQRQFETALERRSYSICSPVGGSLTIGVKHIEGGLFSSYINRELQVGDSIVVSIPRGDFNTQLNPTQTRNYLLIAAGSGITPILSILETLLKVEPQSRATLIYGNRNNTSMMFLNRLSFIKSRYMSHFNWINIFSRQKQEADLFNGHIDNKKGAEIHQKLIPMHSFDEFFLCGPESMISEITRGLTSLDISQQKIHSELFASSVEDARLAMQKHHARSSKYAGKISTIEMKYGGREYQFELAYDGENILDAGLHQGANLPFSCKGGICSTCKCRLLEGEVEMDVRHGLQQEEIDNNYILSCQAHPLTDKVKLDFDQI